MVMGQPDISEIRADEFHPAARSAYRWLKGFMVANADDYLRIRTALEIAAAGGNRQAEICSGTIARLRRSLPVGDRYLLGLCWTILTVHNFDALEAIAEQRLDPAHPPDASEFGKLDAGVGQPHKLALIDARLDEVKRFGAVLQRKGQLNGAKATHYHNRIQGLTIERDRIVKAQKAAA
jgi:hypothetical protein